MDDDALLAGILGTSAPRTARPPAAGGGAKMAVMTMLAVSNLRTYAKDDFVGGSIEMIATDIAGAELLSGVTRVDGSRALLFTRTRMNEADHAAKLGSKNRVERDADGSWKLSLGEVVELSVNMKKLGTTALSAGNYYSVEVTEVMADKFSSSRPRITTGTIRFLYNRYDSSPEEEDRLLVAAYHATQLNHRLGHLLYSVDPATGRGPSTAELKKAKASAFTPDTRHLKINNTQLPFIPGVGSFKSVYAARLRRHLPALRWGDPGAALDIPENWPHSAMDEQSKALKQYDSAKFSLTVTQSSPRVNARSVAALPLLTPESIKQSYDTEDMDVTQVFLGAQALSAYCVLDRRHWNGVLRYLVAATPAIVRTFVSNSCARPSNDPNLSAHPSLLFSAVGKAPEQGAPSNTAPDTTAVLPFLADGVMNAGYPIDQPSLYAIMGVLNKREKNRYNQHMALVRIRKQPGDGSGEMPTNPLSLVENTPVVNLLEGDMDTATISEAEWWIMLIPNRAAKCISPDSLGMEYLRSLPEAEAPRRLGAVFLSLAQGKTPSDTEAADVFSAPSAFEFLLFAVRRSYATARRLSPFHPFNHLLTLEREFAKLYPADCSDVASMRAPEPSPVVAAAAPPPPPPVAAAVVDDDAMLAAADAYDAATADNGKRAHLAVDEPDHKRGRTQEDDEEDDADRPLF